MFFAALVLAVAAGVAPIVEVPLVNSDGELCFTVQQGERSMNFKIPIPEGTPKDGVAQIEQFYITQALDRMNLADRGNPFVEPWTHKSITPTIDSIRYCRQCGGGGSGGGYRLWFGTKWPSGACVLCTGQTSCRVYCFPTAGYPCPNPCV